MITRALREVCRIIATVNFSTLFLSSLTRRLSCLPPCNRVCGSACSGFLLQRLPNRRHFFHGTACVAPVTREVRKSSVDTRVVNSRRLGPVCVQIASKSCLGYRRGINCFSTFTPIWLVFARASDPPLPCQLELYC